MRTFTRTVLVVLSFAAVALCQTGAAPRVEEKSSEHRSFSGVHDLIVENVRGFIEVTAFEELARTTEPRSGETLRVPARLEGLAGPVRASNGNTVEVEVAKTLTAESRDRLALAKKEVNLAVAQEGGLVRLTVDGPFRNGGYRGHPGYQFTYDFTLRVPREIRLELSTVNDSHITVVGTAGQFDLSNVNGPIDMREVEGFGSVHTVNGGVKATFARNPSGPAAFKTVNGTLDVTLRPGLNANLMMKTMHGDLLTDFPVTALPVAAAAPEREGGKYVWRSNRMTGVRVGAGGPELRFETLNGDVLIKNRER